MKELSTFPLVTSVVCRLADCSVPFNLIFSRLNTPRSFSLFFQVVLSKLIFLFLSTGTSLIFTSVL